MRISRVEAIILPSHISPSRPAVHGEQAPLIIRIETDDGIVGYGEADTFAPVAKAIVDAPRETDVASGLAALLIGQDPLDLSRLYRRLSDRTMYYGRSGVVTHALSGIEIALWDILGKVAGRPVADLLGGRRRDRARAYATTGMPSTPDELARTVDALRDRGFRAMKFGSGPLGADAATELAMVAAARRAVGDDGEFMLDLGRRWGDPADAIARTRRIAEFRPGWIEEPFGPDDHAAYSALAAATSVPIAAGEQDSRLVDFDRLIEAGVAVVQPDACRAGGLTECLRVAALATRRGRRCVPHEWGTGIAKAATLHLLAAMPAAELFEYRVTETPTMTRLTSERFPVVDGWVRIPDGPGLGIAVDEDVLDEGRRLNPGGHIDAGAHR